jgi:hypothetical protein
MADKLADIKQLSPDEVKRLSTLQSQTLRYKYDRRELNLAQFL